MSAQKILFVVTQAPYSNSAGQEALDALLIAAAFEQEISVLFIHNGVFQLKNKQDTKQVNPTVKDIKQFTKTFKALNDFGVDKIYVDDVSLASRGLDADQLILDTQVLSSQQIKELIAEQYRVFTF